MEVTKGGETMDFTEALRNELRDSMRSTNPATRKLCAMLLKATENLPAHHSPQAKRKQIMVMLNKLHAGATNRGQNTVATEIEGWILFTENLSQGSLWAEAA